MLTLTFPDALPQARIGAVWSCDGIPHPGNHIALAELLATAVRNL